MKKQVVQKLSKANEKSLGLVVDKPVKKVPKKKVKVITVSKYIGIKKTAGPTQ